MEKRLSRWMMWRVGVLALLFAGTVTLGQSFQLLGTAEWVTAHKLQALLAFVGCFLLYGAGMALILHLLGRQGRPVRCLKSQHFGAGLLLCWLPWYACLFPGTVSNDSISQLMSVLGLVPLTNANPLCQTGLVAFFRWLGLCLGNSADLGIALYCITQALLMAWLLGAVLGQMAQSGAGRGLVYGSFTFYALCPVFPVFAFCVGKDTNFAMAVLWLMLEAWRVTHGESDRKPVRIASMALAAVACTLLRNPGIYVALLTTGLVCLWALLQKGDKPWQAPAAGAATAAALFVILQCLILPQFAIAPMPETEEYSIPLQQIARVAAGDGLTEEQVQALSGVLPVERLKDAYIGELSDPVKNLWKTDATAEEKAAFWRTWLQVLRTQPMTCFSATFHNTYGYLCPGFLSTIKPTLIIGDQTTRTASVRGLYDFSVNPRSVSLKAYLQRLNGFAPYRVLIAPGLYGWIALAAAVLLARKGGMAEWLCAVPVLFTLLGCLLSAVNAYFRYAMPLYLCAPFLLWLLWQQQSKQ